MKIKNTAITFKLFFSIFLLQFAYTNIACARTYYTAKQKEALEAMSKLNYDPFEDAAPDEEAQDSEHSFEKVFGIDLSSFADMRPEQFDFEDSEPQFMTVSNHASNVIYINLASDTLTYGNISTRISHGRKGFPTPTGTFYVNSHERNHLSHKFSKYDKHGHMTQAVYMPYSLFFIGGAIAMHEGNPNVPSHGCIHVPAGVAEQLYRSVPNGTRVVVR